MEGSTRHGEQSEGGPGEKGGTDIVRQCQGGSQAPRAQEGRARGRRNRCSRAQKEGSSTQKRACSKTKKGRGLERRRGAREREGGRTSWVKRYPRMILSTPGTSGSATHTNGYTQSSTPQPPHLRVYFNRGHEMLDCVCGARLRRIPARRPSRLLKPLSCLSRLLFPVATPPRAKKWGVSPALRRVCFCDRLRAAAVIAVREAGVCAPVVRSGEAVAVRHGRGAPRSPAFRLRLSRVSPLFVHSSPGVLRIGDCATRAHRERSAKRWAPSVCDALRQAHENIREEMRRMGFG